MEIQVINVQDKVLSSYIQSFLFLSASGEAMHSYMTFPNTNLCLSIYRNNNITYFRDHDRNLCQVTDGHKPFKSLLYGFHDQPFNATVASTLDQICILFHPGAIRAFTNVPFDELLASDFVFETIFSYHYRIVLEQIFSEISNVARVQLLERFLLSRLVPVNLNAVVLTALKEMNGEAGDLLKINDIARRCSVNPSTLYRLFLSDIGQSPKSFFQTIRFRKALRNLLHEERNSFTKIAYSNSFYDQPHFNKEIKKLSGHNPGQLRKIVSIEQKELTWVNH